MSTPTGNPLCAYIGCRCIADGKQEGWLASIDLCQKDNSITMITVRYSDKPDDWDVLNDNEKLNRVQLLLYPVNEDTITDEVLITLWPIIGGTPHLFEYGKDSLKTFLLTGYFEEGDESALQMDFFTMTQIINKLRSCSFDCDDFIPQGMAIDITMPSK